MLFLVGCPALSAAKEPFKVGEFQGLGLTVEEPTTELAFQFDIKIFDLHVEMLFLLLQRFQNVKFALALSINF